MNWERDDYIKAGISEDKIKHTNSPMTGFTYQSNGRTYRAVRPVLSYPELTDDMVRKVNSRVSRGISIFPSKNHFRFVFVPIIFHVGPLTIELT